MDARELREKFHTCSWEAFKELSREQELDEWRRVNQFCGVCGQAMRPHPDPRERAFQCPHCGYTVYPKIAPAVIVLITKGDAILLQHNSHYGVGYGTLVAGFVDPGESFEEAVRREAREEASIELKDLRYFGSQTWPFPSNIMVGFTAEWASGELKADGEEVLSSAWYSRDRLPDLPRPNSIARRMIDAWLSRQ